MASSYLLSYTSASLLSHEMETIAGLFKKTEDWNKVKVAVLDENILQKGTVSTRKREFSELKKRLITLTPEQLSYLANATGSDARHLSMLSCFKSYRFIYDFSMEVVRDKSSLFDLQILNSDYEAFYESKRVAFDNLNTISDMTQTKLKQVMFKMLEQAGLIESVKTKIIQRAYLSEDLIKLIVQDDPKYLSAFLYSDSEIKEYTKRFT